MPFLKLQFRPGIVNDVTAYANEGGWRDGNLVRFRLGFPESIGGWGKYTTNTYLGTTRSLVGWTTLSGRKYLGVGTNIKLYVEESGDFYDITPIRDTNLLSQPFVASIGTNLVTVTDPNHAASAGDYVSFSGAESLDFNNMKGYYGSVTVRGGASATLTGQSATGSVGSVVGQVDAFATANAPALASGFNSVVVTLT